MAGDTYYPLGGLNCVCTKETREEAKEAGLYQLCTEGRDWIDIVKLPECEVVIKGARYYNHHIRDYVVELMGDC
jgi:hypothetical protein